MLLGDGGRDGQPDAEAGLLFLIAGRIRPVKAEEELIALLLRERCFHSVGNTEHGIPAVPERFRTDAAAFGRVLDRVVAQGGDEPLQGRPVAGDLQGFVGFDGHFLAAEFGHGDERFRGFLQQGGKGNGFHGHRRTLLFHSGEVNQFIHQAAEGRGLLLRAADPGIVRGFHVQQFHVGGNDRERCFQLVAGVGDEFLLLLHIPDGRFHGFPAGQYDDEQGEQDTAQAGNTGNPGQGPHRGQAGFAVHDDDAGPLAVLLPDQELVIPDEPAVPAGIQRFLRERAGAFLIQDGHILQAEADDAAFAVQPGRVPVGLADHIARMPVAETAPFTGKAAETGLSGLTGRFILPGRLPAV